MAKNNSRLCLTCGERFEWPTKRSNCPACYERRLERRKQIILKPGKGLRYGL